MYLPYPPNAGGYGKLMKRQMNKNTIIGFVLIGVILFGFTWYQSKEYEKQAEYQAQVGASGPIQGGQHRRKIAGG